MRDVVGEGREHVQLGRFERIADFVALAGGANVAGVAQDEQRGRGYGGHGPFERAQSFVASTSSDALALAFEEAIDSLLEAAP